MKHKVIQNNLVLHHGEKNNSSNPFSYQENSSRQRTKRLKTLVSSSLQPWRSSTFFNSYINFQKRIRLAGIISCILLLALTAFTLRPISAETSSAEATTNPSTTTLTVETSDSTATLDITPTSPTGTFSSSDTSGTSLAFNVSTNNITGYNLSISHESATTPAPLTNETLSQDLDSLPTGTSISDFEFSDSTYVGYYGYKPSKLNSITNSNYISAPTTTSTTINVTECANNTTNCNTVSDEYTIALGANIDYTKPAGTYTNTFILAAVANNVPYTINYLDNTGAGGTPGTDVSNLPDPESSSTATATNFTLSSTIPTRTGYTFAGWCYGTVTHNATGNDTCTTSSASGSSAAGDGITYQPDSTFSFANYSSSTNVANLYAMWNVKTYSLAITFAGEGIDSVKVCKVAGDCTDTDLMGTVSVSDNSVEGLVYNTAYYLYPTFTSTSYVLDSWSNTGSYGTLSSTSDFNPTFTIGAGNGAVTVTGKTSKIYMQDMVASQCTTTAQTVYDKRDEQAYLVQKLADGKCWLLDNLRLGSATLVQTLSTSNTNMSSSVAFTLPASSSYGFTSYNTAMINTAYANTTTTGYGSGSKKIGVYYNYCAASAGTYCYASGSGNASYDVCPAGWRMPTGGSSGEYQALCDKIKGSSCGSSWSDNQAFRAALSTPLSGYFYASSAFDQGSYGYFWSSTYYDRYSMYYLYVNSSNVYPQYYLNHYRYAGFSVRCVLKQPIESVTYMQDVTAEMIANTAEGATAILRDKRDEQEYTVAKINGNLWMTRNLAIGCNGTGSTYGSAVSSKPLTSDDSNVTNTSSSPWNTPTTSLTSGNSFDDPRMTCSSTYGAWYNYVAASAGTITGDSNSTNATKDICPAGWRLPTDSEQSGITSQATAFSPVTGGYYVGGSINYTGEGYWWSATAANYSTSRYTLYRNGSSLNTSRGSRDLGFYVRCIRSS